MIDHVEIKTVHFDDCKHFYQTVLRPLHMELKWADDAAAGFGLIGYDKVSFLIEKFDRNTPCHLAFSATTSAQVDAFTWQVFKRAFAVTDNRDLAFTIPLIITLHFCLTLMGTM